MRNTLLCLLAGGAVLLGCGGDQAVTADNATDGEGGAGDTGSGGKADVHVASGGRSGSGGKMVAADSGGAPGSGGSAEATGGTTSLPADAGAADMAASADAPVAGGAEPYGCAACKRLFNGVDLAGWDTAPGAWEVKSGVLTSKGIAADIYTHDDLGDYRIFFQVRHVGAMGGKDHKPCTVMFGKRPGDPTKPARALGGAQFQPPLGGDWDYGVGGKFTQPNPRPMFDDTKWHQCEVLVREAGSFHAACCPIGDAPCKTLDVLSWKGPGKKHPFDIMMHNGGLFDEYKEIWIELNPTGEALLSQK
jgi:hypothetical protein